MAEDQKLDRREFLRRSAVTGISLSVFPLIDASAAEEPSESKIHIHTVPRRGRPSPARISSSPA